MSEKCGIPRRASNGDDTSVIGQPCKNPAGLRTDHMGVGPCYLHGGNLPTVAGKGIRLLTDMKLRREMAKFAEPINDTATPEELLIHMVREAASNVAFLGARVSELAERMTGEVSPALQEVLDASGHAWPKARGAGEIGSALYGPVIALDRDGDEHVVGEEYRAATKHYLDWADRLVKYSKVALDAGIAKAQVELAQQQGQTIVIIINKVLGQMGLDEAKQIVARELIAAEMRQLGSGEKPKEKVRA